VKRFLKAKGDSVKKASKQLKACLAWRESVITGIFHNKFFLLSPSPLHLLNSFFLQKLFPVAKTSRLLFLFSLAKESCFSLLFNQTDVKVKRTPL